MVDSLSVVINAHLASIPRACWHYKLLSKYPRFVRLSASFTSAGRGGRDKLTRCVARSERANQRRLCKAGAQCRSDTRTDRTHSKATTPFDLLKQTRAGSC